MVLLAAYIFSAAIAAPLTFDQCVELARENNPEVLSAKNGLDAARYAKRGAFNGFLPTLTAGTAFNRDNVSQGYSSHLTLSQNLFTGLADRARVGQAESGESAALATLDATLARVSFELKSAFAGLVFAQDAQSLFETILQRRKSNLALIDLRWKSGRENKGSVLQSAAYAEQAALDSLQAKNALQVSRAELARLLGRNDPESLEVAAGVPQSAPPAVVAYQELALETPAYREAIAKEKGADAGVDLARAPFFPSLNLKGTTGTGGGTFFPRDSRSWGIEVGLSVPLFNGGKDYYSVKGAVEGRKAATLTRENALRAARVKLEQAHSGFVEMTRKLDIDRTFVNAAEVRARIGREKYNAGLLSFEEWEVIENDWILRQKTWLQSQRDRVVAEAAWEQAQGKGVFSR